MPSTTLTAITTAAALAAGVALGAVVGAEDAPAPIALVAPVAPAALATRSAKKATVELCNGLDDDWDGVADETFLALGRPCDGPDEDEVQCGRYVCTAAGTGVECDESEVPRVEWCDEIDNDCDGATDEGFKVRDRCAVGVGECKTYGRVVCSEDRLSSICNAVAGEPQIENCADRLDNDCDGLVDGWDVNDCPGAKRPIPLTRRRPR